MSALEDQESRAFDSGESDLHILIAADTYSDSRSLILIYFTSSSVLAYIPQMRNDRFTVKPE